MANLNKVLLIGRLGHDPEKRVTPAGHSVVNVSLATTEKFKDHSGNRQERAEWHKLVFWDQKAELVEQYCRKGSQLFIEGSLQTREWQDKDGNKRWTTEINVRNLQFLDSKSSTGPSNSNYQQPAAANNQSYSSGQNYQDATPPNSGSIQPDDFIEDDIPF